VGSDLLFISHYFYKFPNNKMSKITLQCVKEKSKLRIKFHSFTDDEGQVYLNVYDNSFNCKFPRDIREEGRYYEIGVNDLSLVAGRGQPFYNVRFANIKIVAANDVANKPGRRKAPVKKGKAAAPVEEEEVIDIANLKIFEVNECVACLGDSPTEVLIPCAHKCLCKDCCDEIKKHTGMCPLCRRDITSSITA
jgi:hypothetical protein